MCSVFGDNIVQDVQINDYKEKLLCYVLPIEFTRYLLIFPVVLRSTKVHNVWYVKSSIVETMLNTSPCIHAGLSRHIKNSNKLSSQVHAYIVKRNGPSKADIVSVGNDNCNQLFSLILTVYVST